MNPCSKCGVVSPEGSAACFRCGAPLGEPLRAVPASVLLGADVSSAHIEPLPRRRRRVRRLLTLAALFLLLPLAVAVVVLGGLIADLSTSEAFGVAELFLEENAVLAEEIGTEVEAPSLFVGEVDEVRGLAMFLLPVRGSEGIGSVSMTLVKAYGHWDVVAASLVWPGGRRVALAGKGWSATDTDPPCPRRLASFAYSAEEVAGMEDADGLTGPEFDAPGAARPEGATPDPRSTFRRLSAAEVLGLGDTESVRLGDRPAGWSKEAEDAARTGDELTGAPLKPVELVRRRKKVGRTRAVGYRAAEWLSGRPGYDKAAVEWIEGATPMVLYFRADWCPHCEQFEAEVLREPRVREALDRMVKVRVNPEVNDWDRRLADAWEVGGYPTLFVLSSSARPPVRVLPYRWEPGRLAIPRWRAQTAEAVLEQLKDAALP